MVRALAVNGSPRVDRGHTALVLGSFIQGMTDAGSEVDLFYASRLKIRPCACGVMHCWSNSPGECCVQDDMQVLYPKLRAADVLVLATPVYIPLPGDMQNFVNRLCPLIEPTLERRRGRTRARFRDSVNIKKIVLVATSGWREIENFDTVLRIAKELAEDASVEFAGAVLRPHAWAMKAAGKVTADGEAVLDAVRRAGHELVTAGQMNPETLEAVSHSLIPEDEP
jgi:multimeric flavodoxin WrbA